MPYASVNKSCFQDEGTTNSATDSVFFTFVCPIYSARHLGLSDRILEKEKRDKRGQ